MCGVDQTSRKLSQILLSPPSPIKGICVAVPPRFRVSGARTGFKLLILLPPHALDFYKPLFKSPTLYLSCGLCVDAYRLSMCVGVRGQLG